MNTHCFDDLIKFFEKYNIPLKDNNGYYRPIIDLIPELYNVLYKDEKDNKNVRG